MGGGGGGRAPTMKGSRQLFPDPEGTGFEKWSEKVPVASGSPNISSCFFGMTAAAVKTLKSVRALDCTTDITLPMEKL